MMGIRKLLDYVFTRSELKILDDILPEHHRIERLDEEHEAKQGEVKQCLLFIHKTYSLKRVDAYLLQIYINFKKGSNLPNFIHVCCKKLGEHFWIKRM